MAKGVPNEESPLVMVSQAVKSDPENAGKSTAQAYSDTLRKIATNQVLSTEETEGSLSSKKMLSRVQLFMVAQANNSLLRVYKLTEFLDKFSDNFMKQALDWSENGVLNPKSYESVMSTILNLLNYSHGILSTLLNEDRLGSVVIDNSINIYNKDSSEISISEQSMNVLSSDASRERVRSIISKVIMDSNKKLKDQGGTPIDASYIDNKESSKDDQSNKESDS